MDLRDGSTHIPPEVVEVKWRNRPVTGQLRDGCGRNEGQLGAGICRIEDIVLNKLKNSAVELFPTALGYDVDRSGRRTPKFGVVVGALHRDFLNELNAHFVEYTVVRSSVEI